MNKATLWLKNTGLRNKLIAIILLVSVPVLLFFSIITIVGDFYVQRAAKIESLNSIAHVIAENSRSAVLFEDSNSATSTLQSLNAVPDVTQATIYLVDKTRFVSYHRSNVDHSLTPIQLPDKMELEGVDMASSRITLWTPITLEDEHLGTLILTTDLSLLMRNVKRSLLVLSAAFVVSVFLIFSLSHRLQQLVSNPLIKLKESMHLVSQDHQFELNIHYDSKDEIGELYQVFTQMLAEINQRDKDLLMHQAHLTELVTERTAELSKSNQSLLKAKDEAEDASRVKSEFIATMSHEIRTPLNGLLGMIALMLENKKTQIQERQLRIMHSSGQSLLHIVNEILDFSKLQARKLTLDPTSFELQNFTDQIGREFSHRCSSKLLLLFDIPPGLDLEILADQIRLRQVIYNLLGNAFKFCPAGEIVLAISGQDTGDGNWLLEFSVSDTGIGIDPEQLNDIQNPFVQADGSTSRQYGGTGLGLSICNQLLRLMNSSLKVESKADKGSRFGFTLNLPANKKPANKVLSNRPNYALIVDESVSRVNLLTAQLNTLGVESEACQNLHALAAHAAFSQSTTLILITEKSKPIASLEQSEAKIIYLADNLNTEHLGENQFEPPFLYSDLLTLLTNRDSSQSSKSTFGLDGQHHTILVVDDGSVNRETAAGLLQNDGFKVEFAMNGEEAFQRFRESSYDLILMDCSMPKVDGFEATQLIRTYEQVHARPSVPIVAMTAHDWSVVQDRCEAAGMDDYLNKPYTPAQLRSVIAGWLKIEPQIRHQPSEDIDNVKSVYNKKTAEAYEFDEQVLVNIQSAAPALGNSLVERLIAAYFEEVSLRIDAIESAIKQQDLILLTKTAHALSSGAANLGLLKLKNWCKTVERERKMITKLQHDELHTCIESAKNYLQLYLKQMKQ
jgi:two-component system sensor histidine kinase/response regulator